MLLKNSFISSIIIFLFSAPLSADTLTADMQRMLNRLGYNAGPVDGAYGKKTKSALIKFYTDSGSAYDGELDANEISDVQKEIRSRGIEKYQPRSSWKLQVGFTVNKNEEFRKIYNIVNSQYGSAWWFGRYENRADFNGDGINDILLTGTTHNQRPVSQGGKCKNFATVSWRGLGKTCIDTILVKPQLMFGRSDGTFEPPAYDAIIHTGGANSQKQGTGHEMSIPLLADYNNDGVLDFYISSAPGTKQSNGKWGAWDALYLSNSIGNWVWSTDTNISGEKNLFSHGAAQGDIDGDGDIDIIASHIQRPYAIKCLFNDGEGLFTTKNCTTTKTIPTGLTLDDFDNDGDLDLYVTTAAHKKNGWGKNGSRNRLFLNNGVGQFSESTIMKNPGEGGCWDLGLAPISGDFDDDGDADTVEVMVRDFYVLAGIRVNENLGNLDFKSRFWQLTKKENLVSDNLVGLYDFDDNECQTSYNGDVLLSEANDLNLYPKQLRRVDVDGDGDLDILILHADTNFETWFKKDKETMPLLNGSYIENNSGPISTWKVRSKKYEKNKVTYNRLLNIDLRGKNVNLKIED